MIFEMTSVKSMVAITRLAGDRLSNATCLPDRDTLMAEHGPLENCWIREAVMDVIREEHRM